MFDFAWSEIGLIGLVAVLVLGPKELPQAMRTLGRFTRQARKLAGDFQGHVNDLIREAELDDIKQTINRVSNVNVGAEIDKLLDPDLGPELEASLTKAEQDMQMATPQAPASPPVSPAPVPPEVPQDTAAASPPDSHAAAPEVRAPSSEGHP